MSFTVDTYVSLRRVGISPGGTAAAGPSLLLAKITCDTFGRADSSTYRTTGVLVLASKRDGCRICG